MNVKHANKELIGLLKFLLQNKTMERQYDLKVQTVL